MNPKSPFRMDHLLELPFYIPPRVWGDVGDYRWEIYVDPPAWVAKCKTSLDHQVNLMAFGDRERPSDDILCPIRSAVREAWDRIFFTPVGERESLRELEQARADFYTANQAANVAEQLYAQARQTARELRAVENSLRKRYSRLRLKEEGAIANDQEQMGICNGMHGVLGQYGRGGDEGAN